MQLNIFYKFFFPQLLLNLKFYTYCFTSIKMKFLIALSLLLAVVLASPQRNPNQQSDDDSGVITQFQVPFRDVISEIHLNQFFHELGN
jgi:hypothetical protein